MANKKIPTKTIQLVFRPAPPVLKIMVILLILFSIAALGALRMFHLEMQAQNQFLRDKAALIEYENTNLEKKQGLPDSIQTVQNIAKEELGLISPDTVIINPVS